MKQDRPPIRDAPTGADRFKWGANSNCRRVKLEKCVTGQRLWRHLVLRKQFGDLQRGAEQSPAACEEGSQAIALIEPRRFVVLGVDHEGVGCNLITKNAAESVENHARSIPRVADNERRPPNGPLKSRARPDNEAGVSQPARATP